MPAREDGWLGAARGILEPRLSGTSPGEAGRTSAMDQTPAQQSLWLGRIGLQRAGVCHLYGVVGAGTEVVKPQ